VICVCKILKSIPRKDAKVRKGAKRYLSFELFIINNVQKSNSLCAFANLSVFAWNFTKQKGQPLWIALSILKEI